MRIFTIGRCVENVSAARMEEKNTMIICSLYPLKAIIESSCDFFVNKVRRGCVHQNLRPRKMMLKRLAMALPM